MEPATVSYFNTRLPLEDRFSLIRDAGFRTISVWGEFPPDSGFLNLEARTLVSNAASKYGLAIHSVHAPFERANDLFSDDESDRQQVVAQLRENLHACAELGAGILIIHHQRSHVNAAGREEIILSELEKLLPDIHRTGVKIALENMLRSHTVPVLDMLLEQLPDEFGLCYDSSHARLSGDPFGLLSRWKSRLMATHISDNRGILDDHLLPWEGTIDWDRFAESFPWDDYQGVFLMEAEMVASSTTDPAQFLQELWDRSRKLIAMGKK